MDKNTQDKSSKFFKKEGFYVVLFVCLCIIAVATAFGIRNARIAKKPAVTNVSSANSSDKDSASLDIDDTKDTINNATEAKDDKTTNNSAVAATEKENKSTAVANTNTGKFINPVEGTLAKTFSNETQYCETLGTWRTHFGIDIKADLGKTVKAVQEGVVTKVANDNTEYGQYIEIKHPNGLVTRYGNLDTKVSVKVNAKVKQGDAIGTVGKTSGNYSNEKYGSHLHFQFQKEKKDVDPAKYVSYKEASTK